MDALKKLNNKLKKIDKKYFSKCLKAGNNINKLYLRPTLLTQKIIFNLK